jgi:hypothetical protein
MDVRMHAIPRFLVPSSIQEEEAGAVIVDIPEVTQIFHQFIEEEEGAFWVDIPEE